ncbi:mechanosensitive ion channel family protein [Psychroflexus longus]|nr:mechanosensitive ion channel family protein [Psychroflexus longus]
MDTSFIDSLKSFFKETLVSLGPKILYSLVVFILGILIIKLIMRLLKATLKKSKVELSLKTFVESLSVFILYGLLFTLIGSILGVKATSFLAIFGAAGIAIGLALQGSLANFAGGVLILVFKPFKVGDLVKVNQHKGHVAKIDILYTRIKTFDGRIITMPNGNVANSDVDNRTMEPTRRIDLELRFTYKTDIDQIREVVLEALKSHKQIETDPEPDVWLEEFLESEMRIVARCWVDSQLYWPVFWEQMESVKKALDIAGLEISMPQRVVYQGGEYIIKEKNQ